MVTTRSGCRVSILKNRPRRRLAANEASKRMFLTATTVKKLAPRKRHESKERATVSEDQISVCSSSTNYSVEVFDVVVDDSVDAIN